MNTQTEAEWAAAQRNQKALNTNALLTVLVKLDRILTGSSQLDIQVESTNGYHGTAPSWTDGKKIVFDETSIPESFTNAQLVSLFGLNYHELAHILYTPISKNAPIHSVLYDLASKRFPDGWLPSHIHAGFNILEDQRIERLMIGQWPSTKPYFVNAASDHILNTLRKTYTNREEALANAYTLILGRSYLGSDVIRQARGSFITFKGAELADKIESIVKEYQTLVYPDDTERAAELILDLYESVSRDVLNNQPEHGNHGTVATPVSQTEQNKNQKEAQGAASEAEENEAEEEQDAVEDSEGGGTEKADEGGDEGGSGSGEASDEDSGDDSDGNGSGEGSDSEKAENHSDNSRSQSAGSQEGSPRNDISDLKETLRSLKEEVLEDNNVLDELVDVREKMNRVRTFDVTKAGIPKVRGTKNIVLREDIVTSRKIENEFRQLITQADPGWESDHSDGRINIGRAMNSDDLESVWDRWEPGHNDVNDLEVVLLIDTSGSMKGRIEDVSRFTWAVKRALDSIDASTTVLTYDSDVEVLFTADQKAIRNEYTSMKAKGGTSVSDALTTAKRVLDVSKRTHKIIITMTDGSWHDSFESEKIIRQLNKGGCHTALAYLSGYKMEEERKKAYTSSQQINHCCQTTAVVADGKELAEFASKVVKNVMKETINGKRG